jgi:hypothetical protein
VLISERVVGQLNGVEVPGIRKMNRPRVSLNLGEGMEIIRRIKALKEKPKPEVKDPTALGFLCVTMHEKSSEYVDIDDGRIKIFLQKTKGRSASVLFIAAKSVKIHRKIESF